jgi:DNA-binding LacI/PurR family transcriptional regulator
MRSPEWTIGLVLVRPTRQLGAEPFFQELLAGIENVLGPDGSSLLLQVVVDADEEFDTYRRWADAQAVDAVFLVDMLRDDPRIPLVHGLRLPLVVIGETDTTVEVPIVITDNSRAVHLAVEVLTSAGHRSIARVSGSPSLVHVQVRSEAFAEACTTAGVEGIEIAGDFSPSRGATATREILDSTRPPTAILFDNDLMALGGLAALRDLGLSVPQDVSILAWDDSALCQLATPPLSAIGQDILEIGEIAATAMLSLRDTGQRRIVHTPRATFIQRHTVGPAPSPRAGT